MIVLPVTVSLSATSADVAYAGTYIIRSCNVPGHQSAPVTPWTFVHTTNTYTNDECASGGGFGISAGVMPRATSAAAQIFRPTEGSATAIRIRRVRLWMIARLSGTGSQLFVAMSSGDGRSTVADYPFGPPGGDTLSSPYVGPDLLPDTTGFIVLLSCSGSTWEDCTPASPNPLEIRGAEVTLFEDVLPSGSVNGGSLLNGAPQSGERELVYSAMDGESGVAEVSALLGTTVVATENFSSACPHSDFAACLRNRTRSLMIDTRKVPNGLYPLTIKVVDAAGNESRVLANQVVHVANQASENGLNGAGATADVRLTASFRGKRGAKAMTAPYRRSASIVGRLASTSPIANATLEVEEVPQLKGARGMRRTVLTRRDGSFVYRLRPRGMSRSVTVQYRPVLGQPTVAASTRLRFDVAPATALRVALRKVRLTYRGRVLSRPIPARGKLVYVEGRAGGGRWTAFAARRTDRSGRFSGRYRLRVYRPGIRLQFRVRVPRERGYPYSAGAGRPVARIVR